MSDHKKDTSSGEIWVVKFTEESAYVFREQVIRHMIKDPSQPIVIYIDSYGGSVDALAKMIDTLEQVPAGLPIITVCIGKAMSCGAILLSHGDIRYCAPNSRVLIHEVSATIPGSNDVHDINVTAEETGRINKHFLGLLAKNCNIKGGYQALRKMIKNRDGRDWYMDAAAAKKFGLIDKIGTPELRPYIVNELGTTGLSTKLERRKNVKDLLNLI